MLEQPPSHPCPLVRSARAELLPLLRVTGRLTLIGASDEDAYILGQAFGRGCYAERQPDGSFVVDLEDLES